MNSKILYLGAVGLAVGLIAACHDHHGPAPKPPAPAAQSLDTAQVLALAQQTSETSSPFPVNGGLVTLNDTSESTPPIMVNTM